MTNSTMALLPLKKGSILQGEWHIQGAAGGNSTEIYYRAQGIQSGARVFIREFFPELLAIRSGLLVRPRIDKLKPLYDAARAHYYEDARKDTEMSHESIASVIDYFQANRTVYVVTDHVAGEFLSERLARREPFGQEWLDELLGPLLEALSALQEEGFAHLDVTPESIFLRDDGGMPILWGASSTRQVIREKAREYELHLQDPYASPEQVEGKNAEGEKSTPNYRSDIYSLAATISHCLTGAQPVPARRRLRALRSDGTEPQPPCDNPQLREAGYRVGFLKAVDSGMALDPEDRPRTLLEWNEQLFWDESGSGRLFGRLWVDTQPEDAFVSLADGRSYSPGMRLDLGECRIKVEAPYYQSQELSLQIEQGPNRQEVVLSQYDGQLWVETVPENAGMRLDGAMFHSGDGVTQGKHVLRVGALGYFPETLEAHISDQETRLQVRLRDRASDGVITGAGAVLIRPATKGDLDRVFTLLQAKAEANAQDRDGQNAIMAATKGNHVQVIESLLKAGGDPDAESCDGETALMLAAQAGHEAALRALLGVVSGVDFQRWDGVSALMMAAENGHVRVVETLLRAGASVSLRNEAGETALTCAVRDGHMEVVEILLAACAAVPDWQKHQELALFAAARGGHRKLLRKLLQEGMDVQAQAEGGLSLLMLAVQAGRVGIVKDLLEQGCAVNVQDQEGRSALQIARELGNEKIIAALSEAAARVLQAVCENAGPAEIRELLDAGYAVDAIDVNGRTALMVAGERSDKGTVELLLAAGADPQAVDSDGKSVLEYALASGSAEVVSLFNADEAVFVAACGDRVALVRALVDLGVNVDWVNEEGKTALIVAAMEGFADVVACLLGAGAEVSLRDQSGRSAMEYALAADHTKTIRLLNEATSRLLDVVATGDKEKVAELLDAGFSVDVTNRNGETVLTVASRRGDVEMIEKLLAAGADVNVAGVHDCTALIVASAAGQTDAVAKLLEAGADWEARDDAGRSALLVACEQGIAEVAQILLRAGASAKVVDDFGNSALMAACKSGSAEIVKLLTDAGVDTNVKDNWGKSALIFASERGGAEAVSAILDAGGDVDAADQNGRTALMYASARGDVEAVRVLLEGGADLTVEDQDSWTALMHAGSSGSKAAARAILKEYRNRKTGTRKSFLRSKDEGGRNARQIAKTSGQREIARYLGWQTALARVRLLSFALVSVVLVVVWAVRPAAEEKIFRLIEKNNIGAVNRYLRDARMFDLVAVILKNRVDDVNSRDQEQRTPLLLATELGREHITEALLTVGADMESQDQLGKTPLHLASQIGHARIVRLLLDRGADINAHDNSGLTPLCSAVVAGQLEILPILLAVADPAEACDTNGRTPLMYAVRNGLVDLVELLLRAGADPDVITADGASVLDYAAQVPDVEVVQLLGWDKKLLDTAAVGDTELVGKLLRAGAKVDFRNTAGESALMHAAASGNPETVRLLVAVGSDVHATDNAGRNAVDWAHHAGHLEVEDMLRDAVAELVRAIREGFSVARVDAMIRANRPVNTKASGGITPLLAAVDRGSDDLLKLLLDAGAAPNLADNTGRTPLLAIIRLGKIPLATALLAAGASVAQADLQGVFPLLEAVRGNDREMTTLLLRSGANPNRRTEDGKTLLYLAAEGGLTEVLAPLLEAGVDADADGDGKGDRALLAAVRARQVDAVEVIAPYSNLKSDGLRLATSRGYQGAVDVLAGAGDSRLYFETDPPDTRILIRGINLRYYPGIELPPGVYDVRVSADHFHEKVVSVNVVKGDNREVVQLQRSEGRLNVRTRPEGALLWLNGAPFQSGDWAPLGEHQLKVMAYGFYRPAERTVKVQGEEQTESIRLLQNLTPSEEFRDCESCPVLVYIPTGEFLMGSPHTDSDRTVAEEPQHRVLLGTRIGAGKFEVSFAEWEACAEDGGCGRYLPEDMGWGHGAQPVLNVSWNDAQSYLRWLTRTTGKLYRLPTEAEWEYFARAGTTTRYTFGNSASGEHANFNYDLVSRGSAPSSRRTVPVGQFPPNAFGLYDVHGNVLEWTQDCWHFSYKDAPADGSAWETGGSCSFRVIRGGSYRDGPVNLRSAARIRKDPVSRDTDFGIRVVREITE